LSARAACWAARPRSLDVLVRRCRRYLTRADLTFLTIGTWARPDGSGTHFLAAESRQVMPRSFECLFVAAAGAGRVADNARIEPAVAGE
jgi:hypothetical protein